MSLLSEILIQLLGEGAAEAMSKDVESRAPFPEGEGNASLGAVSLFSGALALVFSGLFFASTLDPVSFNDVGAPTVLVFATCALLAAFLALRTGRKAPKVTRRHLGMALAGTCLALPAMLLSVAAIAMGVVRLLGWIH